MAACKYITLLFVMTAMENIISMPAIAPSTKDILVPFAAGNSLIDEEFNRNIIEDNGSEYSKPFDFLWLNKNATNLVGGDMVPSKGKQVMLNSSKWPKAEVPYVISSQYTDEQQQVIAFSMNAFHDATCIRFVPRTIQTDYIQIMKTGTGCNSAVGFVGGIQKVSLDDGCISSDYPGLVMHEFMHALGFAHEHQRYDQENYVNVFYHNIQPKQRQWYKPLPENTVNTGGLPYDTNSVMHYPSFSSFAINMKSPTIVAKNGAYTGNDQNLSELDIQKLNTYYSCMPDEVDTIAPMVE